MNDPPRLRDRAHNPLISEMLSAAGHEQPRRRAMRSTLLAAATAAGVVGGQATAGAAIAGTTAASLTKLAVKWTLLSAVVVGGGVAGVERSGVLDAGGAAATAASVSIDRRVRERPARSPARIEPPARVEDAEVLPEAAATEPVPQPSLPAPASTSPAEKARRTTQVQGEQLEHEVALLDRARRALNQGLYADVDRITERYLAEYPRGKLEQEARYLKMQAARLQGDRERATAEANVLLQLNPTGPHAKAARQVRAGRE